MSRGRSLASGSHQFGLSSCCPNCSCTIAATSPNWRAQVSGKHHLNGHQTPDPHATGLSPRRRLAAGRVGAGGAHPVPVAAAPAASTAAAAAPAARRGARPAQRRPEFGAGALDAQASLLQRFRRPLRPVAAGGARRTVAARLGAPAARRGRR